MVRARDERLDADVAVKLLAENHSLTPDVRERFVTEGQLLRRARSPHVVAVHDVGETESGQPFLVLELVTGGDLASRRKSHGTRPVTGPDVAAVAVAVAAALTALHEVGVVHRDVTPGNLLIASPAASGTATSSTGLLGPGESVLLADLGLSKDLAAASGLTVGAGTAGFSPPEQRAGGWVDQRADIWSASALVVWLLLGRAPDDGHGWVAEVRRLGWPDAVIRVLRRGLSTDPRRRHPTALAWSDELTDAIALSHPRGPRAVAAPTAARPRSRTWLLAGMAVALASLLAVAGWWAGRAGPGASASTRALDDGRVEVSAVQDGLQATIIGPARTVSGTAARFDARVQGGDTWFWIAPDGLRHDGVTTIEVRTRSAGLAEITLIGLDDDGRRVVVQHDLHVDAP